MKYSIVRPAAFLAAALMLGFSGPTVAQEVLKASTEFVELAGRERHILDAVSPMRHRLDFECVLVLEHLEHIVERIVEPRITLRDEGACGSRRSHERERSR